MSTKDDIHDVKKLDNDETFNNIKTGITTYDELPTDIIKKNYKALYNHIKTDIENIINVDCINDITWISKYFEHLKTFIQTYTGYKKDSTRRFQYETIAWILLSIDKHKHKEDSRWFWNEASRLQNKINDVRDDNLLTNKQLDNFVYYLDLLNKQQILYDSWLLDLSDNKKNIYNLIVSINTLIPPIRKNYHDMEFWRDEKAPPENDINYLWEQYPGLWTMVINHDKIESKRKIKNCNRQEFKINDEIENVTKGYLLNDIINKSLEYYPRKYLLTAVNNVNRSMNSNSYNRILQTIFKKKVTQNLIRKSWVNYWYYDKRVSMNIKKLISTRMRHSIQIAEQSYLKVNLPEYTTVNVKPDLILEEPPEVKKEYFNPVKYSREYRKKHSEKLKIQRAEYYQNNKEKLLKGKIIWMLNVSKTVKYPSKKSISKYNLNYNVQTKQWE